MVVLFALPVAAGCGGDGDSSTTPATETPVDLSGELITASDLPGRWRTLDKEVEQGPSRPGPEGEGAATFGPMCPDGETATLDDPEGTVGAAGNASIILSSLEETQLEVEQWLFHDDDGSLFEALSLVFESCTGPPFVRERGPDEDYPDETFQYEPLDIALPDDDAFALVGRWDICTPPLCEGELNGGETGELFINVGTVTMILSVLRGEITEPFDDELLVTAATAAIDRLTDDVWSPPL
jgi:hypothetical protein